MPVRCGTEDGEDGPVVVSDDGCLLELEWQTRFACTEEFQTMNCMAHDGTRRFDISRLIDSTANYFAEDEDTGTTFLINVCRPMVPDTERLCPLGAADCALDEHNNAISLGVVSGQMPGACLLFIPFVGALFLVLFG